jgi:hypothetical protein|tara:strand:+ start:1420 stop:1878 length:459 start_codon:yes stop_codon:yes gene_type:complete
MDELIKCVRCDSDACYKQEVNEGITNYMCYGCGFISNSLMKEGEEYWEQQLITLPELYKDLIFKDKSHQNWIPNTVNNPEQGMVFVNGGNKEDWNWSAVKAIKVKDVEKVKYPIPGKPGEYYKHRMDMENMKDFDKERGYMDALSYIGVLPE